MSLHALTLPDELHGLDLPGSGAQLDLLREALPAIRHASARLGGKRQTQFMDRVLTLSQSTPERTLRQILAELDKTLGALRSAHFRMRKAAIRAEIQRVRAADRSGTLQGELALVKAEEVESGIAEGRKFVSGAIRKAAGYVAQYRAVLQSMGVEEVTEGRMEELEEEHHIRTAFTQGLCAARANRGVIDHGNQIYLHQLGINGAVAQRAVSQLLTRELEMLAEGREPTHAMVEEWLGIMAVRFAGCSAHVTSRGLEPATVHLALTSGVEGAEGVG